ncbi:DUF533 domain-containing protein [Microvirga roseola]|uniref:DUF533 domain-containing protein n=1 Tax=Microvirga roseola TaxID=2883126 RepID=UPI001E4B609A|nr:DUF533 domain-containing protein [Microvirga roseola]
MFDAKKLLDALGTQAAPAAPAPAGPAPAELRPAETKPAAAGSLGAGTLLSELIGFANQPPPPPPPSDATPEDPNAAPEPAPARQSAPPPPADLTDLLLKRTQEFLKTPQGNAVANAVVLGVTKAVVNSQATRRLATSARVKGTAFFSRFMRKDPSAPLIEATATTLPAAPAALPAPVADHSGETALLIMRAMIAAAAADGRIDPEERERILGTLERAGFVGEGMAMVEAELSRPASVADLAAAVKTPAMAEQVYSAARHIITPNSVEERVFLAHLSAALGLDPRTVARIDAAASGAIGP